MMSACADPPRVVELVAERRLGEDFLDAERLLIGGVLRFATTLGVSDDR